MISPDSICIGGLNGSHRERSADLQSAVSQVFNLHASREFQTASTAHDLPIANRRYSRLQVCATWQHASLLLGLIALWFALGNSAHAQTNFGAQVGPLNISFNNTGQPQDVDIGIKVLFAITLLTLAPSIILLMTCFTRIVIVLSFVRTALSLQGAPANQILIGLSLFMTYFIMEPVWGRIQQDALAPYEAKSISSQQALDNASTHLRTFMLKQARPKDVELFATLAKLQPTSPDQLPLKVVIPGFIISELRTAFQMGFLLFVPFILIDLIVATVLMSMGMMMMPPMTISMPLKILLFVLVDGWSLVVRSLIQSFGS